MIAVTNKYNDLVKKSLEHGTIDPEDIKWVIESNDVELLPLLYAAYQVRSKFFGNKVKIHILNNVQNGNCTEDCSYCAQSRNIKDKSNSYSMKSEEEIISEAEKAYKNNAYRYCMVLSGRDFAAPKIKKICSAVKVIKSKYPMEVCVSAGFLTNEDALELKKAGVNRYNHNLNTSMENYKSICTSHEFTKRLDTIRTAKDAGLDICSGFIVGLGETTDDLINLAKELKNVNANSVPINFFLPFEGHSIKNKQNLTPQYCLKILALFRLALPSTEIRVAGGREYHLRSMQALSLYAVDSLFAKGYLTFGGESIDETKQMIVDAGFEVAHVEY